MKDNEDKYIDIPELSFEGFNFSTYYKGEKTILAPQMEALGYTIVGSWFTTEGDSFGPLRRGVAVITPTGEPKIFIYG